MSPDEFRGKVAIVTGAGGGIGFAEAESLAELGAHVVINDVRLDTERPKGKESYRRRGRCELSSARALRVGRHRRRGE